MDYTDRLILLVSCIVEIYILFDFFCSFSRIRNVLKCKWWIGICAISIFVLYSINLIENSFVNLLLVPILLWIFVTIVFSLDIRTRMFYFIVAYSILIGCEFLYLILSRMSTWVLSERGFVPLSNNIWQLMEIKLLTYIVFSIAKQISNKAHKHMNYKIFMMYLCLPIATLGIMLTVFYSGVDFSSNKRQKILMALFFSLMLFGNILMFYAFNKYSEETYENLKRDVIIMKQNVELSHLQEMIRNDERQKEFIHDTSNYLKIIESLAEAGENSKIREILRELNYELEKNTLESYSDNLVLNALISEKVTYAKKNNVQIDVFLEPNIQFGALREIDMISMIGNLLDNAIRGAQECENFRIVQIRIFMQNKRNILVVKIVNNCTGKILIENGEIKSTKKEQGLHGLGIKSVNHTAEKYDGYLEYYIKDEKFVALLILPVE